jgi:sugar phosphate isomerase/epimerase
MTAMSPTSGASAPPDRLLSLAAGTVLDLAPADAVAAAAAAGWSAVGVWYDPVTWSPAVAKSVVARLADTGLIAFDIEPVIFGRGAHHGSAIIDAAAEIGARFVLVASGPAGRAEVVDELGALADLAADRRPQLTLVLEFLPIFTIGTLDAAVDVVTELARPNLAVLVDTLHLDRSGGGSADLARHDRALFPYLQLADATVKPADPSMAGLREEALHGRLLPGDGGLALNAMVAALPGVPISVELRSRALVRDFPDPVERARRVLAATRRVLTPDHERHDLIPGR